MPRACQGGARNGLACSVVAGNTESTSLDCPPTDGTFYLALGGTAGGVHLSNHPRSMSAADGLFCQGQVNAGAFGNEDVRRIDMPGIAAGSLMDHAPQPTTLLDLLCDGSTGNPTVDEVADFPGPQGQSLAGILQLTQ